MKFLASLYAKFEASRLHALIDKSAWILIAPALVVLFMLDPSIARTLIEWSLYALVLAGVGIIVSRVTFPQIALGDFVDSAKSGNVAAAIVTSSIIAFVGIVLLAMVLWAKA